MLLIKPSYVIETPLNGGEILASIERYGRTCYKSECHISDGSAERFVKMLLGKKHESVIEHVSFTVRFVVDRGVSHELVRHRLASYSQESTRYCNYEKKGMTFVIPPWIDDIAPGEYMWYDDHFSRPTHTSSLWLQAMLDADKTYHALVGYGWTPQQARCVLPNSLKTEVVMTANLRSWRHVLKERTSPHAHPQMREVMCPLLEELKALIPIIFDDITPTGKETT